MPPADNHYVLGVMSGSSLDGLDLAVCRFAFDPAAATPVTDWEIVRARTVPYPADLEGRLRQVNRQDHAAPYALEADLAHFLAGELRGWLPAEVSAIGYHGHTHLHEPAAGFSIQLGNGATIAALTGLPTVTDLRSADIAAGGQGAPLAPVADKHLFPAWSAFLNLGGIANFSVRQPDGTYVAGDVSGCCQVLDRLASELDLPYDEGGAVARSGRYLPELAARLEALPYHRQPYPKSLANRWVRDRLQPILHDPDWSVPDCLHTFCRWLSGRVATDLAALLSGEEGAGGPEAGAVPTQRVLVSGGGARNHFLLDCLNDNREGLTFVAADEQTADFKEAALIALCALLRLHRLPNSLASATGACRDTVNGAVYV